MNDAIQVLIGDKVEVHFAADCIYGTVKWKPQDVGENCWIIHGDDGTLYSVQRFDFIRVLDRKVPNPSYDTKQEF